MHIDPEPPELPSLPVGEAVVAGALAAHAAEKSGAHGPIHTHCENCGTRLEGPWCHKCGQHDFEFHRSFWHVFHDALENFFHFDAKLFRNFVTLLFRPGRLTADFNAGKRASQMPPFRLYLFVSILFFFVIFLGREIEDPLKGEPAWQSGSLVKFTKDGRPATLDEALEGAAQNVADNPGAAIAADRIKQAAEKVRQKARDQQAAKEATGAPPPGGSLGPGKTVGKKSAISLWAEDQGQRLKEPEHRREMVASFIHSLHYMVLFCLPCFALYTRVLFYKSRQVYLQHLVVALHFHTFIFLWVLFRNGWAELALALFGRGTRVWVLLLCNLWMFAYPFLMLRRLFGQSWFWTIFKTGLLWFAYFMTLAFAFVLTALILFALA